MKLRFTLILAAFVFSAMVLAASYGAATTPQNQFGKAAQLPNKQIIAELPEGVSSEWWTGVQEEIRKSEYKITWQDHTSISDVSAAWQAPNRAHNLRSYFTPKGIWLIPRTENSPSWQWGITLTDYGYSAHPQPVKTPDLTVFGNRIQYRRGNITEWYVNDENGIEQGFILEIPLSHAVNDSNREVVLRMELQGNLNGVLRPTGDQLEFTTAAGVGVLNFGRLKAYDATGKKLAARFDLQGSTLNILVNTLGAVYPINIDPLATTPSWTAESNQVLALFGYSVGTAGDVNGDGYSDIIVGAPYYDNGQTNEGRAYVFDGSASGPSTSPDWTAESDEGGSLFGSVVGTAGDVNGDGYSDVVIGSPRHTEPGLSQAGGAYVYYGSASGLGADGTPANADWAVVGDQAVAQFGAALATAGDVNGDGYSDLIVGSKYYDYNIVGVDYYNVGKVFVYHGSAIGLSTTAARTLGPSITQQSGIYFGAAVATAGDVNGDGYSDVIVGAPGWDWGHIDEGKASIYYGSATGVSATANRSYESDQEGAELGTSVGTAGDVNGDGYSDIIIGAPYYDNGQTDEGRAYVFEGSAFGPGTSPDWTAESDEGDSLFGSIVGMAGDVNGDGYSDVIIGSPNHNEPGLSWAGGAYIYYGSADGLGSNGTPANANWVVAGDQAYAWFGAALATAGDVNGDGYSDIIIGAHYYDNPQLEEGRAYVYLGSAEGPSTTVNWTVSGQPGSYFGKSVSTAGDVNGDGYADVIVGAPNYDGGEPYEGAAFFYYGSATGLSTSADWMAESNFEQAEFGADFGYSVSTAGDVNGDGYDDVLIGSPEYNPGTHWGAAFVFHGSSTGLDLEGTRPSGTPQNADWYDLSRSHTAQFGGVVSNAGDVNGDGYSDIMVSAPTYYEPYGMYTRVFVYHGSETGLSNLPDWEKSNTYPYEDSCFGCSVGTAGDVNGDGYSDVIVGAHQYGDYEQGAVFVYHGSATGLSTSADWTADGSDFSDYSDWLGISVGTAGDVNGDGYADIIMGAPGYYDGVSSEGAAFVFHGSATGLGPDGTASNADWTAKSGQLDVAFANSVGTAGDVNGDGYADVIIGAPNYVNGGAAFVHHGSATGLSTSPDWSQELPTDSVATAGDVNGDGYADIIVGPGWANGARAFYGNGGGCLSLIPRQRKSDDSGPIAHLGMSDSEDSFSLSVLGRTPYGRSLVKMEWEVKPLGTLFDGLGTEESADWIDTGTAGAEISELVEGLSAETLYHWRIRLNYHPAVTPYQQHSRWLTIPWNGWQEADLRTPVECQYDLDLDGDVDGSDLATYIADGTGVSLENFASEFGRTDCR